MMLIIKLPTNCLKPSITETLQIRTHARKQIKKGQYHVNHYTIITYEAYHYAKSKN